MATQGQGKWATGPGGVPWLVLAALAWVAVFLFKTEAVRGFDFGMEWVVWVAVVVAAFWLFRPVTTGGPN